jgi:hypothetical protein
VFVAISSIEIQTIGTISMKFENLKIMTQEWFLSIFGKIWPPADPLRPENLTWPNHALYRKF